MNKQELANYLATTRVSVDRIEELLTNFINSELAAKRPKIDLLGAGIVEPETIEPVNIKPEDMVSGEWYVVQSTTKFNRYLFMFSHIDMESGNIHSINGGYSIFGLEYFKLTSIIELNNVEKLSKATREEVTKFFPNEFEIDRVTDEQL